MNKPKFLKLNELKESLKNTEDLEKKKRNN